MKTAKEDGGFGNRRTVKLTIVGGPPAAGKSTWVKGQRRDGDVVWDWDAVLQSLTGGNVLAPDMIDTLKEMRTQLLHRWRSWDGRSLWMIVSRHDEAKELASKHGGTVHVMATNASTCMRRIAERGREDTARQMRFVEQWWSEFEAAISENREEKA